MIGKIQQKMIKQLVKISMNRFQDLKVLISWVHRIKTKEEVNAKEKTWKQLRKIWISQTTLKRKTMSDH